MTAGAHAVVTDAVPSLDPWAMAALAACVFAVDPAGLGGIAVRAAAGPVRERWLAQLTACLPEGDPIRRMPVHAGADSLIGGLDLNATLSAGRPVAARGLLAEADGGVVILAMAERVPAASAAIIAAAMDTGHLVLERDGLTAALPARFGIIALDEGDTPDDTIAPALDDRAAFRADLHPVSVHRTAPFPFDAQAIRAARVLVASVTVPDGIEEALCASAAACGIESVRAPLLALRAARCLAALDGRTTADEDDAAFAAQLVLAPRATMMPVPPAPEEEGAPDDAGADEFDSDDPPPEDDRADDADTPPEGDEDRAIPDAPLEERMVEAVAAAIPAGLLERLKLNAGRRQAGGSGAGAAQKSLHRGRPLGAVRGDPRRGARLDIIATLRAAAPWQTLRARQPGRVAVRSDDFRIKRYRNRTETTAIFVVDASGSAAVQRLGEAKGAVERLLADCYVRRDQVAFIAFRGQGAELLLPPTRSLTRAKRALTALPGGGGTPLAAGLDAAMHLADAVRRKDQTPLIIVLTDGRANIARDGGHGREAAHEDALGAARAIRMQGVSALVVDIGVRPHPRALEVAAALGGDCVPMPPGHAADLSHLVQAAMHGPGGPSPRG